jgi:hypothetical protein
MKKFIILIFPAFIIIPIALSFSAGKQVYTNTNKLTIPADPSGPSEPAVSDTDFSNISFTDVSEPAAEKPRYLVMMKAEVIFSDGAMSNGMLYLTNTLHLKITNGSSAVKPARDINLYDISRIDIIRWQPLDNGDGTYLFTPALYKIYTNRNYRDGIDYTGNIGLFNSFDFGTEDGTNSILSYFSDTWVKGINGEFHWQNSKSSIFGYNFTHPVDGVVVSLQLNNNYK